MFGYVPSRISAQKLTRCDQCGVVALIIIIIIREPEERTCTQPYDAGNVDQDSLNIALDLVEFIMIVRLGHSVLFTLCSRTGQRLQDGTLNWEQTILTSCRISSHRASSLHSPRAQGSILISSHSLAYVLTMGPA